MLRPPNDAETRSAFTGAYYATVEESASGMEPPPPGFCRVNSAPISQAEMQRVFYQGRKTAFNDITIGSNASPAKPGWDTARGCGSNNGKGLFNVMRR